MLFRSMSLGIPKVLAVGSFMMSVGAGMYLNPVLSGQFLAFFLDENGKQLITYDDPARLRWAVIGMLVQLGMVIVMTAVSLRKKKTVHAWVASAARRARPGAGQDAEDQEALETPGRRGRQRGDVGVLRAGHPVAHHEHRLSLVRCCPQRHRVFVAGVHHAAVADAAHPVGRRRFEAVARRRCLGAAGLAGISGRNGSKYGCSGSNSTALISRFSLASSGAGVNAPSTATSPLRLSLNAAFT